MKFFSTLSLENRLRTSIKQSLNMSFSKTLFESEDSVSQKRQSFSHRICDDLSEVILQYLPFEDKLRLEGVSKQFQRTVLSETFQS